jgi:maleate isomerase
MTAATPTTVALPAAPKAEILQDAVTLLDHVVKFRIGLVALSTDLTLERDLYRLIPSRDVCVYTSRVEFINPVTPENLRLMQPHIARAAELILTNQKLDSICYGCTSASATLGDEAVLTALNAGKPDTPATNPALAGIAAINALGAKKVSVLTPYPEAASQKLVDYFTAKGGNIISHHCLNIADDRMIAHIDPTSLITAAQKANHPDADAVFLSCTALPGVEVIPELEAALGKPVIISNQAMIWMALRLAGCDYQAPNGGRLFTLNLP